MEEKELYTICELMESGELNKYIFMDKLGFLETREGAPEIVKKYCDWKNEIQMSSNDFYSYLAQFSD